MIANGGFNFYCHFNFYFSLITLVHIYGKMAVLIKLTGLCFLLSAWQISAQNTSEKDSLFAVLNSSVPDTTLALTFLELAKAHRNSPSDSLFVFIKKALDISQRTNYIYGQAKAYQYAAKAHLERSEYGQAGPATRMSILYFDKINAYEDIGKNYTLLGGMAMEKSNLDSASIFYKKALVYFKKIKNDIGISRCVTNMGRVNLRLKNYEAALKYFQDNYNLVKNNDDKIYTAIALNNIASAYDGLGKKEKVREYINRAYEESLKTPNREFSATLLVNLSEIAFEDGKKELALRHLREALRLEEQARNPMRISYRLYNLGEYYRRTGEYGQAKKHYLRSLKMADTLGLKMRRRDNYRALSELHANIGAYKKAYQYHLLLKEMDDSIFNEKTHQQIADIEIKYGTEKKEREIKLLGIQKEIQKMEIGRKNAMLFFLIVIVSVTVILSTFLYFQYKNKNRAYMELVRKNLEEVKKEQLKEQKQSPPPAHKKQPAPVSSPADGELIEKMEHELLVNKIYLDTNLTIDVFAKKIDRTALTSPKPWANIMAIISTMSSMNCG